MNWQRGIEVAGLFAARVFTAICAAIWIVAAVVLYAAMGAIKAVMSDVPDEWRSIVRTWRNLGAAVLVMVFVTAANAEEPAAPADPGPARVEVDMDTGLLTLHAEDRIVLLGTLLKNGNLVAGPNVTGNDFAVAVLIMMRANLGDEQWVKMLGGLKE